MTKGQNQVRLRTQTAQIGQRWQYRIDQFPGQGAISVGQIAAEHFGQCSNRLPLTIARAGGIQPIALVTEEVMEPAHRDTARAPRNSSTT